MAKFPSTAPARLATRLAFFTAGFSMACCAPLFPFIKANVGADERQFGVLLLCFGLGSIIAMPVTGLVAARRGPRSMVMLGGFGLIVFLPALAIAETPFILGTALFLFGASLGTIDVAMNVHGVEVESQEKRSLMSSFHAQFSIGGLFGAGLMTLLLSMGVSLIIAAFIGATVVLMAMLLTIRRLLFVSAVEQHLFVFPRGIVLLLALLAAIMFLVEGAVLDWGALLVIDRQLAAPQNAGVGYILFSAAMVIARLTGDRIISVFGEFWILIAGGIVTILGISVILLSSLPLVALVGFVLIGLGAANLVPIFFSAAGRQKVMPASLAIASVTTTGYAGVLIGPAMIGFTADITSLSIAFWLLALLIGFVPLTAYLVAKK
ncbi:MFS transporter [Candidatus Njordibacter sp. Uisw_039]|jgi:MFS family permease|uniref:MFS transporter n=1 Tax=Candidatus Njordibacter sp. Uisw_039 TaxID=3230972 RepID=UPI003A3B204E|tara:strand:- start:189 stop:1322 length:1134 start_codon:yes stop_codon:yes gene_type:complete